MMRFKDFHDGEKSYLCAVPDSKIHAEDARHKFLVYPSLTRPDPKLGASIKKVPLPLEMTCNYDKLRSRPTYVLRSTLKDLEEESDFQRPFLFGREIIKGARWGPNILKFSGEFVHLSSYWEWTEEVIARCRDRLEHANLHDAVYASLYSYDHDTNILRAFCESWCPKTNTLHMEAGEGSLSLWDLEKLGGLSVSGRPYDEAIPNLAALRARDKNDKRLIPRAFGHLLGAYCLLKDQYASEEGVSAAQWIQFWRRRETRYGPPPKRRSKDAKTRSRNTHNPSGEISFASLDWTPEEVETFTQLQITDALEQTCVYLAAYLSCWLCVFALPEHESRLIRPETFEIAARMADGERISLAVPVLSSIYRGMSKLVMARRPAVSDSIFPAHYLYGWLAHYFRTHHDLPEKLPGPRMVQCSGYGGAKCFDAVAARALIHSGASFRAASILLERNRCFHVCDDNKLGFSTLSYIISLRTAYLPLRSGACLYLEPYHPTRFARQYGFYQEVPGVLPHFPSDNPPPFDVVLKYLKTLLWKGSQTKLTLPGCLLDWADFASPAFVSWWCAVTVTDLRENVQLLVSSATPKSSKNVGSNIVESKTVKADLTISESRPKEAAAPSRKRACDDPAGDGGSEASKKLQLYDSLFGGSPRKSIDDAASRSPTLDKDVSGEVEVELVAESSFSGSLEPFEAVRTTASLIGSKGGGVCTGTAIASQCQPIMKNDDFTKSAALLVQAHWVKKLRDTAPEQVEAFMENADVFYDSIRSFGGDISTLRSKVNAYVSLVKIFLAAKGDVAIDEASIDHAICKVENNLKSVRTTLRDVRQTVTNQEKQLSSIAERRAKLQASLQALDDEEMHVKRQHGHRLEEMLRLEPEVGILEQQHEDLKVSKSKGKRLRELELEMNTMKDNLDVAP